jgi:hypothetical protein
MKCWTAHKTIYASLQCRPSGQNRVGNSLIGRRGAKDVPISSDGAFDGNVNGPLELARLVRHAEGVYIYPVFVSD